MEASRFVLKFAAGWYCLQYLREEAEQAVKLENRLNKQHDQLWTLTTAIFQIRGPNILWGNILKATNISSRAFQLYITYSSMQVYLYVA